MISKEKSIKNFLKAGRAFGLGCLILLSACGEQVEEMEDPDIEDKGTEEYDLPLEKLDAAIFVDGVEKEKGTIPAAKGTLAFEISGFEPEAFQVYGMRVRLKTSTPLAGAYFQLKDVNGTLSKSYFNVPASEFYWQGTSNEGATTLVRIRFNEEMELGKFCFDLAVYDSVGNISEPQELCPTVQEWGGNDEVAGEWLLLRREPSYDSVTIGCSGEEIIRARRFLGTETQSWTFNADGTCVRTINRNIRNIDWESSLEHCEAIYEEEPAMTNTKEIGKWALTSDQVLSSILFSIEDLLDPSQSEDYGSGNLYEMGEVEFDGDLMILSSSSDSRTIYQRQ